MDKANLSLRQKIDRYDKLNQRVISFPLVTIILIAINVAVFVLTVIFYSNYPPTSYIGLAACLKQNNPQCVEEQTDLKTVIDCSKYYEGPEQEYCLYTIKQECLNDQNIIKQCLSSRDRFFYQFGYIPANFNQVKSFYTIFTSMFMHESIGHLLSNMIFLLLVGAYIESRLGKIKYLLLYLVSGIVAVLFYTVFNYQSTVILIGASGAISGLLGANLVMNYWDRGIINYRAAIWRFNFMGFGIHYLLFYIFIQFLLFSGPGAELADIAYAAHIAGFLAGLLLAYILRNRNTIQTNQV